MGEALNMDAQTNNDLRRYVVANPLVLIEIVACLDGLLVLASQLMPSLRHKRESTDPTYRMCAILIAPRLTLNMLLNCIAVALEAQQQPLICKLPL
jgi:hypothetical protein